MPVWAMILLALVGVMLFAAILLGVVMWALPVDGARQRRSK